MRKIKKPTDESNRLTSYYEDTGQLCWSFGRGIKTKTAYLIQANDRQMFVVIEPDDKRYTAEALAQHLDANIPAEVIKCRVPADMSHHYEHEKHGVQLFLAQFHPSPDTRGALASFLWGTHLHSFVFNI